MKKAFTILVIAGIIATGLIYVFIPSNIVVSKAKLVHCVPSAIYRTLGNENKWQAWFPSDHKDKEANTFIFKRDTFFLGRKSPFTVQVLIHQKDAEINSFITTFNLPGDSAAMQWECKISSGLNPVKRLSQYFNARLIKNNMKEILDRFALFVEKQENVYGLNIGISSTKDTLLISTQSVAKSYPTTTQVYALIGKLRKQIYANHCRETGYPMLNIKKLGDSGFRIMVAIPINKPLANNTEMKKDCISLQRMVPGRFVVTDQFSGGDWTINEVFSQIRFYFLDYSKAAVAIPFQSLITERINEPDTSKWITKIYAPVY